MTEHYDVDGRKVDSHRLGVFRQDKTLSRVEQDFSIPSLDKKRKTVFTDKTLALGHSVLHEGGDSEYRGHASHQEGHLVRYGRKGFGYLGIVVALLVTGSGISTGDHAG